jgi:hypothetical protein
MVISASCHAVVSGDGLNHAHGGYFVFQVRQQKAPGNARGVSLREIAVDQ